MLHLHTFGGLRIERDGQPLQLPTQKARDLLGYLITFRVRPHPRSVLVGVLWPDLPEDKARRRLSDTLWRVRHVLGDCVLADEEYVWLNDDFPCQLDVERFEDVASRLELEAASIESLENALVLYRGPFLDGLYHNWVLLERDRLRGLYLEALGLLLEHYKRIGDYARALNVARRLVAVEPLHEAAHRELMRLYHLLGRDAEAVAQYRRCCEILREELSVSPAPETEALYQVLNRRTSLPSDVSDVHLPAPARSPIPHLDDLLLVGRDAERAALLHHLEGAASGRGGVVLLEGEAGIGKSRLAQELAEGARWRNVEVVVAHVPADASSSYGLFLAALSPMLTPLRIRQLARLVEPAHLRAAASLLPSLAETLDLFPPPDLPPPQAHERLQEALAALALDLARIVPCLWVLEDLQDADAETLSLLPHLSPLLREGQGLILLTGRSAELRADPRVWRTLQALDRAGPFPRYTLARLDRDAIGCLVRDLLGEEDASLTAHLMQESGGVPLYLVETLKVWRDEGHLLPGEEGKGLPGGNWHWSGEAVSALPSHLGESVIGHRLSQLSATAEQVLATAAVIGTDVDFDLLARVCAFPTPESEFTDTDPYLLITDELLRLGFLEEADVGYRFSHEQVRQAAYGRLRLSERRRLHRKVALALEDLFPDQFERIAHHFEAAGQRRPAIHYLNRAVERARELFAHQTALSCYDRLLGLLDRPGDRSARYDVLCDRAEVLGWIGDREAQGRDLKEMLRLARTTSDDARLAKALHRRSEWHRVQGRYEAANDDARAALEIYRRLGDEHNRARLLNQLGRNLLDTDDCPQADVYFEQALPIHEAVGDLVGQIQSLMGLACVAQYKGDLSRSLMYCRDSLDLARSTGDVRWINYTLSSVGLGYVDLGDMEAAESHLRKALELAETSGQRRRLAITRVRLAHVALQRGDFDAAQVRLETALETLREVQDISWGGYARSILGEVHLLRGDHAAAHEHLEAACRCYRELGELDWHAISLSYLARAEAALGKEAAAWEHSQEVATKAAAEWPDAESPPEIYYNHYRVAQATRHWAAARDALEEAANVLDERAKLISDSDWRESYRTGLRVNRAITEAIAEQPPLGCLRVRLARADVPAHRRPKPDEMVTLIWTVDAGDEDAALAEREGEDKWHPKVALRRHRILRLLDEAESVGASPTVADLAGALDVSSRTIRSDLNALRDQGHPVRTRGSRA